MLVKIKDYLFSQSSDMKDLPGSPFAASLGLAAAATGGGSRPPGVAGSGMESAFPGGLQLAAAAFQQPFGLHPFAAMDPRLPFSSAAVQAAASGAFRPIFGSSAAAAAAAAAAAGKHFYCNDLDYSKLPGMNFSERYITMNL